MQRTDLPPWLILFPGCYFLPRYLHRLLLSPHTAKCLPKQPAVRAKEMCQHMISDIAQDCDKNWSQVLKIQAVLFHYIWALNKLVICLLVVWLVPAPLHLTLLWYPTYGTTYNGLLYIVLIFYVEVVNEPHILALRISFLGQSWEFWVGYFSLCYCVHCSYLLGILLPKYLPHLSLPPHFHCHWLGSGPHQVFPGSHQ